MVVPREAAEVEALDGVDVPFENVEAEEEEGMDPLLVEPESFCLLLLGLVFEAVIAFVGTVLEPGLRAPEEPGATNCCCP